MTDEQQDRLKQIREHQKRRSNALFQNGRSPMSDDTYAETEFLLNLVDSQVAEIRKWRRKYESIDIND